MGKKLVGVAVIVLASLLLVSMFMFFPSVFQPATTLSITQLYVNPQGSLVGEEWRGSYWNIVGYVNTNDDVVGVVLPEGQKTSITFDGVVSALETGAKVEVKIDPLQPYIYHKIQEKIGVFAPGAKSNDGAKIVSQADFRYYAWSGGWELYVPYVVSVYKDGSLIGQKTLNGQGTSQVQEVPTSEGVVRIENLGLLSGNYLNPDFPSQIAIFKGGPYVYDYAQLQSNNAIYSGSNAGYAKYWFGMTLSGGYAVSPTRVIGTTITSQYAGYPGWKGGGGNPEPLKPVVYSNDEYSDVVTSRCLTEWLQYIGVDNLAYSLFNSRAAGDSGALWQKVSIVDGNSALRLDIPWGAFGTPLVNIRIPTELADTWVEQPAITDVDVDAVWQINSGSSGDLQGSLRIACTVTNRGNVAGGCLLEVSSGNSKLAVTPLSMTVNNLEPNVPQVVYFDATNLGVEQEISNVPITIVAKDTYTGAETGRDVLYGSLLPTLVTGTTTLQVRAVEKGTDNSIPNLQLRLILPSVEPKTVFTGASGFSDVVTLKTPQGGAFIGDVQIQTVDNSVYKASSTTFHIASAAPYSVTVEVERKDKDYPFEFNWMLIMGIIIALVIIAIVAYALLKKKPKRKR